MPRKKQSGKSSSASRPSSKPSSKQISEETAGKESQKGSGQGGPSGPPREATRTVRPKELSGRLYLAIYAPRREEGNVPHWALWLNLGSSTASVLAEVYGGPGRFVRNIVRGVVPERSDRHRQNVYLADLDGTTAVREFLQIASRMPVDNAVPTWNCQQFVMDILEEMHDQLLIEDARHQRIDDRLRSMIDQGESSEEEEEEEDEDDDY